MNQGEFNIVPDDNFLEKLSEFSKGYESFCILNSNDFYSGMDLEERPYYHDYEIVAGFGEKVALVSEQDSNNDFFSRLKVFQEEHQSPLFGYLGYDLKNQIEVLSSEHTDGVGLPDAYFFVTEVSLFVKEGKIKIECNGDDTVNGIFEKLKNPPNPLIRGNSSLTDQHINLQSRFSKDEYLAIVEKFRQHIVEGDVYEVSFCQEFFAENAKIAPESLYVELMKISPNPFSAFMKIRGNYILSSSMERFLKKQGNKLISQPIKGTIRKSNDAIEDVKLQKQLYNDEKERAENVMIVDLVRNDLARSSEPGSVKVEELFGIYPFHQVHQMISTITSKLRKEIHWTEAIRNAFPMGSMTGAPKVRAMQLIEQYERSRRGVFSGAIGYISPDADFDFNVVIRTLIWNSKSKYLSLHVGSAITYDSTPEKEYEECLMKISGIKKVLSV